VKRRTLPRYLVSYVDGKTDSPALAGRRPGATVFTRATTVAASEVAPVFDRSVCPTRYPLLATRYFACPSAAQGEEGTR
jgi:hypothetical protein